MLSFCEIAVIVTMIFVLLFAHSKFIWLSLQFALRIEEFCICICMLFLCRKKQPKQNNEETSSLLENSK
jgi:hypothetical protein